MFNNIWEAETASRKMKNIQNEIHRLEQQYFIDWLNKEISASQMQVVYERRKQGWDNYCIFCALVPNSKLEEILQDSSWDFHMDQGMPWKCDLWFCI